MAVTYGFYDSLNHDRLYNAQQMSAIFDGIINDGVFMSVGNQFHTVAGTGMQVIVKSGRAWFDSTWTLNDAEYPLSIDAADVLLTRIDAVVLEVNSEVATRANTIKVVKGTPASTPAKPTLTNTATIHQHALAYVTVAKNTTAITNSMIEIVVGKTETPYVTAILQTTDITDLFKKWENDFQVWFETVKGTLDGDVALNLQNQIDHCVKKADKATSADIDAGTADKWIDSETYTKNKYRNGSIVSFVTEPDNTKFCLCSGRYIPEYSEILTNTTPANSKLYFNAYKPETFIPSAITNALVFPHTSDRTYYYAEGNYIYITGIANISTNDFNYKPIFTTYRYNRKTNEIIKIGDSVTGNDDRQYTSAEFFQRDEVIFVVHEYNGNKYFVLYAYNMRTNTLINHSASNSIRGYATDLTIIKYDASKYLVIYGYGVGSYIQFSVFIINWDQKTIKSIDNETIFNIYYSNNFMFEKRSSTSVYMCIYKNDYDVMSFGLLTGFDIENETFSSNLTMSTANTIDQNMDAAYWYFPSRYLTYNNKLYIATCRGLISINKDNGAGSIQTVSARTIDNVISPPIAIITYNDTPIAIGCMLNGKNIDVYVLPEEYLSEKPYNLSRTSVQMLSLNTAVNTSMCNAETIVKNIDSNYIIMGDAIIAIDTPIISNYHYLVIND